MNYQLQDFIFESKFSFQDLIKYRANSCTSLESYHKYNISVYRNHSFELIDHCIQPFLDYATLSIEFSYSDYDDSLSFLNLDLGADMVIIWLDATRYQDINFVSFLTDRLAYLSSIFTKQILLGVIGVENDILKDINIKNLIIYDFSSISKKLEKNFLNYRLEKYTGTKLSSQACVEISKDLGLNYLPSILEQNLKAIIVDLDNTLYKGVLGEDGIKHLKLTAGHKLLQTTLKAKVEEGIILCIASKNNESDVVSLFNQKTDFPLQLHDFSILKVNWESKAKSITEIAKQLNIGIDSILFIDDNLGELMSVKSIHPSINTIMAKDNASITNDVLINYPKLKKFKLTKEDSIRKEDLQANNKRNELLNSMSTTDYLKTLNVEVTYCINDFENIERISELSQKN